MLCQEESRTFQILFIPGIFCLLLDQELLSFPLLSSSSLFFLLLFLGHLRIPFHLLLFTFSLFFYFLYSKNHFRDILERYSLLKGFLLLFSLPIRFSESDWFSPRISPPLDSPLIRAHVFYFFYL